MSTTNNITTTYAGEHAGKWVSAALLTSNTIDQGGVTVLPGIKYQQVINKLELNDIVKDATCDFTATSTLTTTERVLTPEEFQVNLQLCKKDYHSTWQAMEMGVSAHDDLPKSFADYLIAHVAAKVAAKNETNIWQGVTATAGEYDGFETLMTSQASQPAAQEIAGTTLTAANVVAQIRSAVDVVPTALLGNPDLRIYMNPKTAKFYVQALGGFGASGLGAAGVSDQGSMWYDNGALSFDGIRVFVANGMSDDTLIITTVDNLYFGTGLLADHMDVRVIDTSDTLGDQNCRVIMRFTAGCQIANPEDVVTYGITNTAN